MKKRREGLSRNVASSRNWFRPELLPDSIKLERHKIEKATSLQCYDGIKILFVENGCGTLVANGTVYSLRPGSCCVLYCYHFHRIIPAPANVLSISICYVSYNTYLFASIVPGYHLIEMEQSIDPVHVLFSEPQQARIKHILAAMEEEQACSDSSLQHALLFEWLGRICRAFSQTSKNEAQDHC